MNIDWASEIRYQLKRLFYVLAVPRIVREAEWEVRKNWIMQDLEHEEEEGY
jgi:hypothetical protein